jgi:hypothetical protein
MMSKEDIQFHSDRARVELDRARDASSSAAAQAHIHLSALHLAKMRTLSAADAGLGPIHGH